MPNDIHVAWSLNQIVWSNASYWYVVAAFFGTALFLIWYRLIKMRAFMNRLTGPWYHQMLSGGSVWRSYCKAIVGSMAVFFFAVALLRPTVPGTPEKKAQAGRDVLFALDISRSMLASDLDPDRLTVAKQKIKDMLHILVCERVGFMVFAGSALVQCPFTSDKDLFSVFLENTEAQVVSVGTTAIEQVLKNALLLFEKYPTKKNKIVVLLTDGEDFSSNLMQTATRAAEAGVHLYILGVASPQGAPIPMFDDRGGCVGYEQESNGKVIISRLHEQELQDLARLVNGDYVRITNNENDIQRILAHIKTFEHETFDEIVVDVFYELYYYPLLASLICFVMEWLL